MPTPSEEESGGAAAAAAAPAGSSSSTSMFSSLLAEARAQRDRVMTGDSSKLQGLRLLRTVRQIRDEADELQKRAARNAPETATVQAQILHAKHGMDVSRFGQMLSTLNLATSIEPIVPLAPTSVEGFLKNERHTALMAAMQRAQKNTLEDFHDRHFRKMQTDWSAEKDEIREILGTGPALDAIDSEMAPAPTPAFDQPARQGRSTMDTHTVKYASVVWHFVQAILEKKPFALVEEMRKAASELDDSRKTDIATCWTILHRMIGIEPSALAHLSAEETKNYFRKNEFVGGFERRVLLVEQHVMNGLRVLESRYASYIDQTLEANGKRGATTADTPDTALRAIVDFLEYSPHPARAEMRDDNDEFVWAQIYFALRCGRPDVAILAARKGLGQDSESVICRLQDFANRDFGSPRLAACFADYNTCKAQGRPFKRAACNILGRCETEEDIHREVAINIEDFLWIKLNLVRPAGPDASDAELAESFAKLQDLISVKYGEAHFQADREALRYVNALLLTAQFEKAIDFLRMKDLRLAVHLAIPLAHYGLLNCTKMVNKPMLSDVQKRDPDYDGDSAGKRLNFALLVQRYARSFAATDPLPAMRYYYLLRDFLAPPREEIAGDPPSLFVRCVTDMILETREWTTLILGEVDQEGRRKGSVIDTFVPDEEARKDIISTVAEETDFHGRTLDAIRLYDLANNRVKVLELLNGALSQDAAIRPADKALQASREELRQFANFIRLHKQYLTPPHGSQAQQYNSLRETLPILLSVMQFFDLYFSSKFDQAFSVLEGMKELNLIPIGMRHVQACVDNFDSMRQEILRNLPQILLAAMTCLDRLFKKLRGETAGHGFLLSDPVRDGGREQAMNLIRDQARALVTFSGMVPFRMPGVTNAELIRMEVGMML